MPGAETARRNKTGALRAAAVLIVLFGAFLRIFRIDQQLIIDDEWHALNAVQEHGFAWIFSRLGHADHSIPLALLYEFLSRTVGLGELAMRMPSLLAGIAAITLLPWLWRHWLERGEALLFSGLIAISPFLVNYSRIARPYALLALLAGASIMLAWLWWQAKDGDGSNRRLNGTAWFCCAVVAAWLNPVSLAVTTAPLLWFAGCAAGSALRQKDLRPLRRATLMTLAIFGAVALLLYAPLSKDFASLAVKSGVHRVGAGTLVEALGLFSGSGHVPVVLFMLGASAWGWVVLYLREREFALYLLLIVALSALAVALTRAEWIFYGLVFARYLIGLLPVYLALAAIGLAAALRRIAGPGSRSVAPVCLPLLLLGLFLAGPLPHSDAGRNQFMHHMSLQFDFNFERNPVRAALVPVNPEPFYAAIAALHPSGDAVVVEAPWHLESNWNALPLYQAVHGQSVVVGFVGGLCAGRLYGELRPAAAGMSFRNFTFVKDVLDGTFSADFLVLRKRALPGARQIEMDFSACERAARDALGKPWHDSDAALVFRLSGAS